MCTRTSPSSGPPCHPSNGTRKIKRLRAMIPMVMTASDALACFRDAVGSAYGYRLARRNEPEFPTVS